MGEIERDPVKIQRFREVEVPKRFREIPERFQISGETEEVPRFREIPRKYN